MNQTRPGHAVSHSEKMICVECFRTRGDGDFRQSCQNPRCHFYLTSPSSSRDVFPTKEMPISFNKEVGYDRKAKLCSIPKSSSSQLSTKEQIWKIPSLGPGLMSVPQIAMTKTRSKPTSTVSSTGGVMSIPRILCGCQARAKSNLYHSRMMSVPESTDSFMGKERGGDLVEDAFVASPLLLDYTERLDEDRVSVLASYMIPVWDGPYRPPIHFFLFCLICWIQFPFVPETDSGISSPFGRPTGVVDWMDCLPTSKASVVPITSAVPTLSSSGASSSNFDMSRMKMEISSKSHSSSSTYHSYDFES